MNTNEHTSAQKIRDAVLAQVRQKRVWMRPRWYFMARVTLAGAVALVALLLSSLVLSFIAFSLHEGGELLLLGFGFAGIATFLRLFPWLLLGLDIVVLAFLEWLLQGFRWGYRVSLLSVFVAVFAASALLAALINTTPLHANLLNRADRGELPILGELYEGIRAPRHDQGIYRGTIESVNGPNVTISGTKGDGDAKQGTHTIVVPPAEVGTFRVGEHVYILGTPEGQQVQAEGMERF